jgi:outer membrane lipoprotein SlyB
VIAASVAIISGCSTSEDKTSAVSSVPQNQPAQSARDGVVIKLRDLNLRDDRIALVVRPDTQGRAVAQVGGAVLGAIADDSTDDHAMPADAQEITIRFDSGAVRVVTQAKTGNIKLNERVKVINSDQHTRVVSF